MPPDAGPWLAFAAVFSAMAMTVSFVRVWRSRIARSERERARDANRPIGDPFKAVLSHEGHLRPRDLALEPPPLKRLTEGALEPLTEVVWSAAFEGEPCAWLYLEAGPDARLVAVARCPVRPPDAAVTQIEVSFALQPEVQWERGHLYFAVPADGVTAPFDRLCLVAAAVEAARHELRSSAPDAVAVACTWFVDGVEFGALPPFAAVRRGETATATATATAGSRLSHRGRASPRLSFKPATLQLQAADLREALAVAPTDVLQAGPVLRVIGGDVAAIHELAGPQ